MLALRFERVVERDAEVVITERARVEPRQPFCRREDSLDANEEQDALELVRAQRTLDPGPFAGRSEAVEDQAMRERRAGTGSNSGHHSK
jgi:hypothetical protein